MEPLIFNIFSVLDWQIIEYSIQHVRWWCHVLVNNPWEEDSLPIRDMHIDFSYRFVLLVVRNADDCSFIESVKCCR